MNKSTIGITTEIKEINIFDYMFGIKLEANKMLIDVKNLKKVYKTGDISTTVLKGVDLELDKGEIGVVLGPSGSGKSTMMNIIGGIDRADSGIVIVDGINISDLNDRDLTEYRREKIGFVFQFYNLIPNLTVGENIEVVSNISKSPLNTDEVLKSVDILDKKYRFPKELSGGEQQRVSIARAVIKNPKLLLCDEPTGALDFISSREILKLLQKINRDFGTTILMITHNISISAMANRVFKVRSGEIAERRVNNDILPAERIEW